MDIRAWIELFGAIGAIAAAGAAWFAIRYSSKQLKIEQTPYVVLDHISNEFHQLGFAIKNIGKGPAITITFNISGDLSDRHNAFFSNDQPHSANLSSSEESHYWKVDRHNIENLYTYGDNYAYIYIFYNSQLGTLYRTNVKVKKIVKSGGIIEFVVMENQIEEMEEK